MGEKICQESRGIILDEADNWKVVCYSFSKFFNYIEGHAAKIDYSKAEVQEKLDGSLMSLFFYKDQWHVASSGLPDASGSYQKDNPRTFKDLFWALYEKLGYVCPDPEDQNKSFAFEMWTMSNKIICQYDQPYLALIGVRDLDTLQELDPQPFAQKYNWYSAKTYPMKDLGQIIGVGASLNPAMNEGFVVVQKVPGELNFRRVKIKSPAYVALAHLRSSLSSSEYMSVAHRRMIEIIQTNESQEFLNYFPEYSGLYTEVSEKITKKVKELEIYYESVKNIETQKNFAIQVKDHPLSGLLFGMRGGKYLTFKQGLLSLPADKLEKILGY
jgi:hypothetical protein